MLSARLLRLALCAAVVAAVGAAAAPGASAQRLFPTILQDDALTLYGSAAQVARALRIMRAEGVDRVRLTADWARIAPQGRSARRPRFDAADPAAYPPLKWVALDRAVLLAARAHLEPMVDIGFFAPDWATTQPAGVEHAAANVDARAYADWAHAVATRYSGRYRPPGYRVRLPAVRTFTIWNEPNEPTFLRPQAGLIAAAIYRRMVTLAYPRIKAAAPGSTVLVGGLAAGGASTVTRAGRATAPLAFLRALTCVDADYRPIRGGTCAGYRRLPGDGFADHPYQLGRAPGQADPGPDDVALDDLGRLTAALDRLAAAGRVAPALRDVWPTEFGYETDVPVASKPWTPTEQAALLAHAEFLAWRTPGVRSWPQFMLRDQNTPAALAFARAGRAGRPASSWQSGLFFEDGFRFGLYEPKPAAATFRLTLWPTGGDLGKIALWGHVRPARGPVVVRLERRLRGGRWRALASRPRGALQLPARVGFSTDGQGIFWRTLPAAAGARYRLAWRRGAGDWTPSPAIDAAGRPVPGAELAAAFTRQVEGPVAARAGTELRDAGADAGPASVWSALPRTLCAVAGACAFRWSPSG